MAKKDRPIDQRIRDYYLSDDGEWLVEKGKVREARMLKEAAEMIKNLRWARDDYSAKYWDLRNEPTDQSEEIAELKDQIYSLTNSLNDANDRLREIIKIAGDF